MQATTHLPRETTGPVASFDRAAAPPLWRRTSAGEAAGQLLSSQEESTLIRRAQAGDERARERLVATNTRLIYSIARRYHCRSMTLDDLVQEGTIGLLIAIDRFDRNQGCRLCTYASHWIRQCIARSIEHNDRLIRLPVQASCEIRQLEQARAELRQRLQREPGTDELAAECTLSPARVSQLLGATDPVSLESLIGPDQELPLSEVAADTSAPDPEQGTLAGCGRDELVRILEMLNPRERRVIEQRYGLDGGPGYTLQEISERMGISREGVRQVEVRALSRLRRALRASQWE